MNLGQRGSSVVTVVLGVFIATSLLACGSGPVITLSPSATPVLQSQAPTTEPTHLSTSQPTLQPTALPSDLPATPLAPSADPVFGDLLPHVPEAVRASCQATDPLEPVSASVSCSVGDGGITVEYAKYPDRDSMYGAYNQRVQIAEIETDSGLCYDGEGGTISATPSRWPAEHDYSIASTIIGRYLCLELDLPTIVWTDDRFNILSLATATTGDSDRLVAFWLNEAGPIP